MEKSTKLAKEKKVGNPLDKNTTQGPQVDKGTSHSILAINFYQSNSRRFWDSSKLESQEELD